MPSKKLNMGTKTGNVARDIGNAGRVPGAAADSIAAEALAFVSAIRSARAAFQELLNSLEFLGSGSGSGGGDYPAEHAGNGSAARVRQPEGSGVPVRQT